MSQGQPRRDEAQDQLPEAITYGDIFNVSGSLAAQAITPLDAALMQSAEKRALGKTLKGGVAAVMQAAAEMNERAGLVDSRAENSVVGEQGVTVAKALLPGMNVTTEYVAGQAIRSAICPALADYPAAAAATTDVTIGEALEAAAMTAGDKPVELSDAVAVQAAERQATGTGEICKGGVASAAQSAVDVNARFPYSMKTTLGDVLSTATEDARTQGGSKNWKRVTARLGKLIPAASVMPWRLPPGSMNRVAKGLAHDLPIRNNISGFV